MSNTYSKLDEKIQDIYMENLEDLGRETAATLNVFQNVSYKAIEKQNLILSDILQETDVDNYPLNW